MLIDYSNIRIEGSNKNIVFIKGFNGENAGSCDDNKLGSVFCFDNKDANTIKNIEFKNLVIDGGVDFLTTSKVFNEKHKAIRTRNNTIIDNIKIENCEIKNFLGEFVYSPGKNGKCFITDCNMYNSKGNGVTFSGETVIEYSKINGTSYGAIEQALWADKPCIVRCCSFEENGGANIMTQHGDPTIDYETRMIIENNYFGKSTGNKNSNGVSLTGVNGVDIINNTFEDCTNNSLGGNLACIQISTNPSYLHKQNIRNVNIYGNKFIAKTKDLLSLVRMSGETVEGHSYALEDIQIVNNQIIKYANRNVGGFTVDKAALTKNIVIQNKNELLNGTIEINKGSSSETKVLDIVYPNSNKIINIKGIVEKTPNTNTVTLILRYEKTAGNFIKETILDMANDEKSIGKIDYNFKTNIFNPTIQLFSMTGVSTNAVLDFEIS